jgi:L-threonylcarbamoyladenylate synthase
VSADEVQASLGNHVDLILDGGKTEGGKGSTVIDLATDPPRIVREGMITRVELREFLPEL